MTRVQIGAVEHVVFVDRPGDDPRGLLGRQAAERLHELLHFALGELRLHFDQALALDLAIGFADQFGQFFLVGPADFEGDRQPPHFGRQATRHRP